MSSSKKEVFEKAKKFLDEMTTNQHKADDVIDHLKVQDQDKKTMKDLLGKKESSFNKKEQEQVVNLIENLVGQSKDSAKKKKAAEVIKKMGLPNKVNPESRPLIQKILDILEK